MKAFYNMPIEYNGLKSFPYRNLSNTLPLLLPQDNHREDEWNCSKHADVFCSMQLSCPFPLREIRTHLKVQCTHASHESLVMKCPEGTFKVLYDLKKHRFAEFSDSAN
ncbi:hypothetical protein CDAR_89691 [Caerostris darwini]|uniref:Uncharacterized protein n=1 Tax=Caerostris darwini TaxID=1538125 RepID=A0AAV4RPA9_9ARAC|nr:hypothetical protein CDAR_89691 [Caerostris darwini]